MKIFLIEDNPIQIEWAKKELAGYEFIIAANIRKGWDILKEATENDIIICDLELPEFGPEEPYLEIQEVVNGEITIRKIPVDEPVEPSMKNGFDFFERAVLPRLIGGKVKGVAIISSFEHHLADKVENETYYEKFEGILDVLKAIGKHEYGGSTTYGREAGINMVCFVDESFSTYENFFFEGEYLSEKDVNERFRHWEYAAKYYCCKKGGILLKKFREAVDLLLK